MERAQIDANNDTNALNTFGNIFWKEGSNEINPEAA